MTKQEKSWILYDVANSAFVLIIITTIMPIFFKDIASKGVDNAVSTANWGFANSAASLILVLLAPILGTLADYRNMKKRFLAFFIGMGILFTLLLIMINEGDWLKCLLIFVIARIGFAGANIFYDSLLPDITDRKRVDWVSSSGYAWGYIGSVIPFLLVIGIIFLGKNAGQSSAISVISARKSFLIVALWWFIFSIPILKNVKQNYFIEPAKHLIKHSFIRLFKTFKEIRKYKQGFLFLIAYFFYIDGVGTIITMATAYGRDIGLNVNVLISVILMIQIVAFPFALIYGKLANRFSAKIMLFYGIGIYVIITFIAFFIPVIPTMQMKIITFWILAFLVATSMGGIQALSRSFFSKLIPPQRSAEFFGFYNIFGKLAVVTGPFLMGLISRLTGHSRYGILSILVLFITGGVILANVRIEKAAKQGWT